MNEWGRRNIPVSSLPHLVPFLKPNWENIFLRNVVWLHRREGEGGLNKGGYTALTR